MNTSSETLFLIDHDWNEAFQALGEYINEGMDLGEMDIDTKFKGISLGLWCRLQCKLKETGRLPESRSEMLEGIGFDFSMIGSTRDKPQVLSLTPLEKENIWNDHFQCVEKFISLNQRAPVGTEVLDGMAIGQWLSNQRYRWNKISNVKKAKLNSLPVPLEAASETKWKFYYETLLEYQREFGALPKSGMIYRGLDLGDWLIGQRSSNKRGGLVLSKVELLSAAGALFRPVKMAA